MLTLPQGDDLSGLKLDADLSIPVDIKHSLTDWRVGFPAVRIDDRDMAVIQGMTATKARVKLFFDQQTGLLTRQVRYINTVVGIVPIEVDYSDYRAVAGVKLPRSSGRRVGPTGVRISRSAMYSRMWRSPTRRLRSRLRRSHPSSPWAQ